MKIKSKKLIELLKTDDTDNLYTFSLEITSDVLNDPEALDEFIKLFKKEKKVARLKVIVKVIKHNILNLNKHRLSI